MGLMSKQAAFVKDVAKLIIKAEALGITLTFGEAYRTQDQQNIYLSKRLTTVNHSRHMDRLAIDFNFFINGKLTYNKADLQELGDYWESLNPKNRWGGNWTSFIDTPHFERRP